MVVQSNAQIAGVISSNVFSCAPSSGFLNEEEDKFLENLPASSVIRARKHRTRSWPTNPGVVHRRTERTNTCFDIAETFATGHLRESHATHEIDSGRKVL